MGYEIKVEGEVDRGLAPWLVAMSGVTVTLETHDGDLIFGEITQVKLVQYNGGTFGIAEVNEDGTAVRGGWVKRFRVDSVKAVSVW